MIYATAAGYDFAFVLWPLFICW